jgi:O-antigen/teichoic acid export membrane protein
MILLIIASILNVIFLVLIGSFLRLIQSLDERTRLLESGYSPLLFILLIGIPILNLISLWNLYFKGKQKTEPLKDLTARLEKIEAALKQEPQKS